MKHHITYPVQILALSGVGVLFSGYLSAVKFFSETCAFNEPCPYFLGYPSCWYGFALFLTLFLVTAFGIMGVVSMYRMHALHVIVSGVGVVFSGAFAIPEIIRLFANPTFYTLGLPTCVYGFFFFALAFFISVRWFFKN